MCVFALCESPNSKKKTHLTQKGTHCVPVQCNSAISLLFVRMNTLNSEIIRARATKFDEYLPKDCMQVNMA